MELDALNENVEAISKLGATLVLISPNTIAHNQSIAEEKKLTCDSDVESATVTLKPGGVTIRGTIPEHRIRALIEQAGFQPAEH